MTVSVQCPTCGNELLAPDELIGKLASCPHCQKQFPITMSAARTVSETPATESGHSEAASSVPLGSIPVAKPLNLRTAPSLLRPATAAPAAPPMSPAGETQSSNAPEATLPTAKPMVPPVSSTPPAQSVATNMYPPGQAPAASVSEATKMASTQGRPVPAAGKPAPSSSPRPAAQSSAPATNRARSSSSKPSREARPARFIAGENSETRVELGHDGQLPVLQLQEAARTDVDLQNARDSNPWLLVAALVFSFGMSAVLLFVDTSRAPTEQTTKKSARGDIEFYYIRPGAEPQPYRELLRQALQAYNRGDYATERRLYKQVLDLLHEENKDLYSGLTGQASAGEPPNDRHLEELLSTLVDR